MIKSLHIFLIGFLLLINGLKSTYAQVLPPQIEGWRIHTSFSSNKDVCDGNDQIYIASYNAMFSISKTTGEMNVMSRTNGLSDVKSTLLAFDTKSKTLVIVYDNANIDLLRNGKITNVPEVFNQRIIGEKNINNLTVKDGKAYLACSFGVVVIDLQKQKLIDSWANLGANGSNLPINDIEIYNDSFYLIANTGIYSAPFNSNNLSDFNNWKLSKSGSFGQFLEVTSNKLYAVLDSTVLHYVSNTWVAIPELTGVKVYNLKSANNKLVVSNRLKTIIIEADDSQKNISVLTENGAIVASDGKMYAPQSGQFLAIVDINSGAMEFTGPAGPQSSSAIRMAYSNKNLWVVGGSVLGYATSSGWNSPNYSAAKFYRFNNNEWFSYYKYPNPIINGAGDFIDVAIHPSNQHAFLANFGTGLLEMNGPDIVTSYTEANSSLQKFITGTSYQPLLVSGVAFDEDQNLWVSNYGAINPISVKTPENTWYNFPVPAGIDNRLIHFVCDDYGNKWFINTRSQGLLVFNENKTFANKSDDQYRKLNDQKQSGYLPSTAVYSITKDKSGTIWVGTQKGLCLFNNPEDIFKTNAETDAKQIVIKTGLVYSNFLGDVPVYCVTVDPGNRKWIGTAQGVWLVSPDGYTVIKNFNTANSPLLSNTVYSIGINESTGEVFFGTENGMCSYMGTSSESNSEQNQVFIYPNPVKPDFSGLIAFRGLTENAYVKITDISGQLVYETRASGGMATWNGISFQGTKAPTGVYLVYSSNEDGTTSWSGKFVILN